MTPLRTCLAVTVLWTATFAVAQTKPAAPSAQQPTQVNVVDVTTARPMPVAPAGGATFPVTVSNPSPIAVGGSVDVQGQVEVVNASPIPVTGPGGAALPITGAVTVSGPVSIAGTPSVTVANPTAIPNPLPVTVTNPSAPGSVAVTNTSDNPVPVTVRKGDYFKVQQSAYLEPGVALARVSLPGPTVAAVLTQFTAVCYAATVADIQINVDDYQIGGVFLVPEVRTVSGEIRSYFQPRQLELPIAAARTIRLEISRVDFAELALCNMSLLGHYELP